MEPDRSDEGFVYVLTNESMPGLIKIGMTRASDPHVRISGLYTTSVPLPFDLEYAALVGNPRRVERAIHNAFDAARVNPTREFFEIEPDQVIGILELIALEEVTESVREEAEQEVLLVDKQARERVRKRRPSMDFNDLGIPRGTTLSLVDDHQVTVAVCQPKKVRLEPCPDGYEGEGAEGGDVSLTPLTRDLRAFILDAPPTVRRPARFWRLPDGRTLKEAYLDTHGPRTQPD